MMAGVEVEVNVECTVSVDNDVETVIGVVVGWVGWVG
jgi:hypothetical protein